MKDFDDTYDLSRGPVPTPKAGGRKRSARDMRVPTDLTRSRSYGLRLKVCSTCGAKDREGLTQHASTCRGEPGDFMILVTGPMKSKETSKDTGWTLA